MAKQNRYVDLQLEYGPNFNQINVVHPSIIKVLNNPSEYGFRGGDRFIVGSIPDDDFLKGNTNDIATYDETINAWVFFTPYLGLEVNDINEKCLKRFNGTEWVNTFKYIPPSGEIAADISGNAGTATKLLTPQMFSISGAVNTVLSKSFDGTQPVNLVTQGIDLDYVNNGLLGILYGGTGRNDGKSTGVATPITFRLSGGAIGQTDSPVSLDSEVVINVQSLNASSIYTGTLSVARGGTGANSLFGMLKGNGLSKVTSAVAGTDYVTPSGSITGSAGSADKLSSSKTFAITGFVTGSASSDLSSGLTVNTTLSSTVGIANGGTGATNYSDALTNLHASEIGHTHVVSDIIGSDIFLKNSNNLSDVSSVSTSQKNLQVDDATLKTKYPFITNYLSEYTNKSKFARRNISATKVYFTPYSDINGTETSNTIGNNINVGDLLIQSYKENITYSKLAAVKTTTKLYACSTIVENSNGELASVSWTLLSTWEDAAYKNNVPVGTVQYYAGSTVPDGYLVCNGQAVNRTTYANLYSIIGTTFGTGDNLTTFNLPDLRGDVIRGLDLGRGIDSSRVLGTEQLDAIAGHTHTYSGTSASSGNHVHTITIADAGSHTHTITMTSNGNHYHSGTTGSGGYHNHTLNISDTMPYTLGGGHPNTKFGGATATNETNYGGTHTHTFNTSTTGAHTHTGTIDSAGTHSHTGTIAESGSHTHTYTGTTDSTGSKETRMRNVALLPIIKY